MDETDYANDLAMHTTELAIREQREKAARIPAGKPGECDFCGKWSGRLVDGACAPCRDRYHLK